jgi:acyl-CoA reductase-like NAD-dependent aldehyde dehydrogenase
MLSSRAYGGHLSIRVGVLAFITENPHIDGGKTGQKCSALSRLYVSSSLWASGFKDQLLAEVGKIKVGPPQDFGNFLGPVMFVFSPISAEMIIKRVGFPADVLHTTR